MLFGAEGVSDGKEFTFRQGGEEETQGLQENLSRHLTLLHQPRCKLQILERKNTAQSHLKHSFSKFVLNITLEKKGQT